MIFAPAERPAAREWLDEGRSIVRPCARRNGSGPNRRGQSGGGPRGLGGGGGTAPLLAVGGFNDTARYARTTNTLDGSLAMERVVAFSNRWTAGGINAVAFSNSGLAGGAGWFLRNLNGALGFGVGVSAAFVTSPTLSLSGVGAKIVIVFGAADGANVRLFRYDVATDAIVEVGAGTSMGGAPVYTGPSADLCIGNRSSAGGTPFTETAGFIMACGGIEGANLGAPVRLAIARAIRSTGVIPSGSGLDLVWNASAAAPPAAQWDSDPPGAPLDLTGTDTTLVRTVAVGRDFL